MKMLTFTHYLDDCLLFGRKVTANCKVNKEKSSFVSVMLNFTQLKFAITKKVFLI